MTTKPKPDSAKPRARRKKGFVEEALQDPVCLDGVNRRIMDRALRRAVKLGSHPLDEKIMAARMAELDRAKKWMAENQTFYQTPPGGEPIIPHEPPRMTIERLADNYRKRQAPRGARLFGWRYWECYRDEMV